MDRLPLYFFIIMKFIELYYKSFDKIEYEGEVHIMDPNKVPEFIKYVNAILGIEKYSESYKILSREEAKEFLNEIMGNDFDRDKELTRKFKLCYGKL